MEFVPSEKNLDPKWHPEQVDIMDWATNIKVGRGQGAHGGGSKHQGPASHLNMGQGLVAHNRGLA